MQEQEPQESFTEIVLALKNLRLANGLSPEALTDLAGLPAGSVLRYEENPEWLTNGMMLQVIEALMPPREDDDDHDGIDLSGPPTQQVQDQMEAKMHELEAALDIDLGRFRDALDGLESSLRLSSHPQATGGVLLTKAAVLSQMGRELRALDVLSEAERCLAVHRKPTLWLRLRLEQMHVLCPLERYEEAGAFLDEARTLAASVGHDWHRLQVRCLHGWVAAGLGRGGEALEVFRSLRLDLQAANRHFDATGIGLDIAGLLAGEGDVDGVTKLADELEPMLGDSRIPVAARTPLKLFVWAARRGNLRAERGRKLGMEFRKAGGRLSRPYELPV